MAITAPTPAPITTESLAQSGSMPAASQAPARVTDTDGWEVVSASAGMAATPEELKARAETVKVEDQPGRRDVRPGSKDSLDPATPAKPAKPAKPAAAAPPPVEGEEPPPPAAAGAEGEEGEEPAELAGPRVTDRKPGETRKQFRARKRQETLQARIDDATFQLRETERQLEARRRELDPDAPPARRAPAADAPPPEDVKPTWKVYQEEGKSWDDYTADKDAWQDREFDRRTAKVATQTKTEVAQTQAVQAKAQAFLGRVNAAREAHPDYDAVVGGLTMENTPFIANLAANSEQGAELLYYLGQNPEIAEDLAALTPPVEIRGRLTHHPSHAAILEALRTSPKPAELLTKLLDPQSEHFERIAGLSGAQAFRELLKLEGDAAPVQTPGRSPATPQRRTAAPPLRPPQGAAAAGDGTRPPDSSALDFSPEFIRAENEAERRRGRRF